MHVLFLLAFLVLLDTSLAAGSDRPNYFRGFPSDDDDTIDAATRMNRLANGTSWVLILIGDSS